MILLILIVAVGLSIVMMLAWAYQRRVNNAGWVDVFWTAGLGLAGVAVSLGLGILTSIVTAVTMTRMMIALWYRWARPTRLPI